MKYECEFCDKILSSSQIKMEREISSDNCYCEIIIKIDKLNKKIKRLEKKNNAYLSFFKEFDNLWGNFNEWEEENYGNE